MNLSLKNQEGQEFQDKMYYKEYYEKANKRLKDHQKQLVLF